jgi:integrase/recombinase XerD
LNLLRNRAFVALLFASGGRVAEVLSITTSDARHGAGINYRIQILGKGRKRRALRVDDLARSWIAAYLDARSSVYPTATALFISHGPKANGKQMSAVSAWRVVKEAALWLSDVRAREGADNEELQRLQAISPHSLRHFLAQALLDEGAEYKDIAALLGHSSTTVTEQVYARQHEEITHEIADTFAPRAILSAAPDQTKPGK